MGRYLRVVLLVLLMVGSLAPLSLASDPFAIPEFERTWARTDKPVSDGLVDRTWMWGPGPNSPSMLEPYLDAPSGLRIVQYSDKSRFEDNTYRASPPWDVTNGLIAKELMTGEMQLGDSNFEFLGAASVNLAGDFDDPDGPTYAAFNKTTLLPAQATGSTLIETVDRYGNVGSDPSLATYGATAGPFVNATGHTVASVFWVFMNSEGLVHENGQNVVGQLFENPFYATGYPLTGAFWAWVKVGGDHKWVLIQVFERRVLTYTPGNPPGWEVEAGNVGQHYYNWRVNFQGMPPIGDYGDAPDGLPTGYPGLWAQMGKFPTLYASDGAHTLDLTRATLGPTASPELDANDPNDPDGMPNLVNNDLDDGLVGLTMFLTQIPPPAVLSVEVHGGTGGDFFLNVLIDLNMDGEWGGVAAGGEPEWVVQNYPVSVLPGEIKTVTPPAFAFGNGNRLPDGAWMRVALTSEPAPGPNWDGRGAFTAGEIEDHVITLPEFPDPDPNTPPGAMKKLPVVVPDCGQSPKRFPPGQDMLPFTCKVTNMAPVAGSIDFTMIGPITGGVGVAPLTGTDIPIAAGPDAEVLLNFVASRGAMPSAWRLQVVAIDPPSVVHPGGVIIGFPDSEIPVTFVGDEIAKVANPPSASPGEWIKYTISIPPNELLEGPGEVYVSDPIDPAFYPDMPMPILGPITCSSGECRYDAETGSIVLATSTVPGQWVELEFELMIPPASHYDQYPEMLVNCAHGFDGVYEFQELCAYVEVQLD